MDSTNSNYPVAIPRGSLVLVTGATSYVASHVIKVFLEEGYRVRGTVRSRSKASFFSQDPFAKYNNNGSLELFDVPDMTVPGAYKEAVKGVAAVINVASNLTMNPDPEKVVPGVVASTLDLLRTAAVEPSVTRFVHCSTMGTVIRSIDDETDDFSVKDKNSWNDLAVERAYNRHPDETDFKQGAIVYAASKVLAEKAAWKFVDEEKPGFVFNTVNPYFVFGTVFSKEQFNTSAGIPVAVANGTDTFPKTFQGSHVEVKDVAVLHFAAAVDPDVKNERILTAVDKFNWNTILALLRRIYPDRKFPEDVPGIDSLPGYTCEVSLALSLLKKWGGRDWIGLEPAIRDTIDSAEKLLGKEHVFFSS